jgi:hypothetical protein
MMRFALGCAAAASLLALAGAPTANAAWGITAFDVSSSIGGQFSRQAGAHPDLTTVIEFPVDENLRTAKVTLPPGFVGDPTVASTCTFRQLSGVGAGGGAGSGFAECSSSAQVGTAVVNGVKVGIYNMVAPPNHPAMLAFNYQTVIVPLVPDVNPSDYSIVTGASDVSVYEALSSAVITLWGVPADPVHDPERGPYAGGEPTPTISRQAFLRTPTSCPEQPTGFTAAISSWLGSSGFAQTSEDAQGTPFRWEGCERVPFAPQAEAGLLDQRAAAPTGLDVRLKVPQSDDPYGIASADVKKATVTLPEGFAISSAAASGRGACSPPQIGLGSNDPPACPDSSRLGTVSVKSPLLDQELQGDVFLAAQKDNPFGTNFAMYLAIEGPGFYIKLPGRIDADPTSGRLTTTFDNQPQLPYEEVRLQLDSGPRAALVSPSRCGVYSAAVELTSWASSTPVKLETPLQVNESCAAEGFNPKLRAGSSTPDAGKPSPFTLQVTRNDNEQNLSRIDATLPQGLLAKLAGVPLCGDAQALTGACPAASQIGKTTVGAGAGPDPIYVPEAGKAPTAIYLAGPYKGAPYSLVVKVPAQAGPFDLGTVAVRSGIYIDPVTTAVSVRSDSLPQILEGVPVAYRDVRVEVDRPAFMLNPTSCRPMKVESKLFGSGGATANPSARFRAVDCDRLGFKPKLAVRFSGAPTHRGGHPALKAVLTMPKGDANIGRAQVTLPKTEFLENAHIRTICTRVQYAADNCPKASIYGFAKAWSPLLDRPLEGPVYLRSSNHTLPDLVASLDGQIHVDLSGRISSANGRIRNTFDFVPDAPVSRFVLKMQGGQKGLLVNNEELCRAKPRATADFTGQNGKRSVSHPLVKVACGGKKK